LVLGSATGFPWKRGFAPGKDYSYTNNWPPEALVDNHPTAEAVVWSVLSLIALLCGIGLLLAVFGRWNFLGWHGREEQGLQFRPPDEVVLTRAQRSCAWYFLVMALLFMAQSLLGGAAEHYRAEISNFLASTLLECFHTTLPGPGICNSRFSGW
jgi:nitric oxide reductase subunit B